jgi:hypothetical protein
MTPSDRSRFELASISTNIGGRKTVEGNGRTSFFGGAENPRARKRIDLTLQFPGLFIPEIKCHAG